MYVKNTQLFLKQNITKVIKYTAILTIFVTRVIWTVITNLNADKKQLIEFTFMKLNVYRHIYGLI